VPKDAISIAPTADATSRRAGSIQTTVTRINLEPTPTEW
jgi:hypothetical protein